MTIAAGVMGIFFAVFTVTATYYQRNQYQLLQNETLEIQDQIYNLSNNLYHLQSLSMLQLMTLDSVEKDVLSSDIKELDSKIVSQINTIQSNITGTEETAVIHELYSNYLNYIDRQKMAEEMSETEAVGTMQYFVNSMLYTSMVYMNEDIDKLHEMLLEKTELQKQKMEKFTRNALIVSILFGLFIIFIMIQAIILMIRSSKSIQKDFEYETQSHREQIISMQGKTISDLAELVESRDGTTGTHVKNTAWYVNAISNRLREKGIYSEVLTEDYCYRMSQFAPLHDVGKILVPDSVLLKPGKLDDAEFTLMKTHAAKGGEIVDRILTGIESEENKRVARNIAAYHHEKWNGEGYPFGLAGEDIPVCARIMAIADVFDALISERCYKKAMTVDEAYQIIEESAGTHFDPEIVDVFVELRGDIEKYLSEGETKESKQEADEIQLVQ